MAVSPLALGNGIGERFLERRHAERYRDRFRSGRKQRTHQREVAALEKILAVLPPLRTIVDVGSGAGRMAPVLSRYAHHLVQADISPQMLEVAAKDFPLSAERGTYLQADARNIPLASDYADLVFCHRLLNHLSAEDRRTALRELARITRAYMVVSCLTAPAVVDSIRRVYRRIRGSTVPHAELAPGQLLREAESTGIQLMFHTTIRRFPSSATFLVLTKLGEGP